MNIVEVLLVGAVLLLVAAVVDPLLHQPKSMEHKPHCLSFIKQVGLAAEMYTNDYDDTFFQDRLDCGGKVCKDYIDHGTLSVNAPDQSNPSIAGEVASSPANEQLFWVYMLNPYVKNFGLFRCPEETNGFYPGSGKATQFTAGRGAENSQNWGGENGFGANFGWLTKTATKTAAIPRAASTILMMDAGFYEAGPDVMNDTGLTVCSHLTAGVCPEQQIANLEYIHLIGGRVPANQHRYLAGYWANQGGGKYAQNGGTTSSVTPLSGPNGKVFLDADITRHKGHFNVVFADGHGKAMPYQETIGDICYWTTDVEGLHPRCK